MCFKVKEVLCLQVCNNHKPFGNMDIAKVKATRRSAFCDQVVEWGAMFVCAFPVLPWCWCFCPMGPWMDFFFRTERPFDHQSRGTGVHLFVPCCYCFIIKIEVELVELCILFTVLADSEASWLGKSRAESGKLQFAVASTDLLFQDAWFIEWSEIQLTVGTVLQVLDTSEHPHNVL